MNLFPRICLFCLVTSTALHAQDLSSLPDTDLPQPLDLGVADELLTHSPFTRMVNVEGSLQLTGIAYVDGRPVATVVNRDTKERLTISEEPNAQGWKITDATPSTDLKEAEVQLMIGGQVVTMRYGDEQLTPGSSKKGEPGVYVARATPGLDPRHAPGGDTHVRTSSLLGENGRELYSSLSRDARDKLKDAVRAHMEKHPEQTMEQNSAYAQKMFNRIKADDQKSGGASTPKPSKTEKKPKTK